MKSPYKYFCQICPLELNNYILYDVDGELPNISFATLYHCLFS